MKNKLSYFASILSIAAIFLSVVFLNTKASSTGVISPTYDGAYSQWTPKSGSVHYTQVDETPCNANTDFVQTTTVGNRDSYGINISSVATGTAITKIEIKPCASRHNTGTGSSTMDVFYRFNGVNSSDAGAYALSGTTPAELATTTFSGLALSVTSSSTLEIGAVLSSGNKGAELSRIVAVITYVSVPVAPSGLTVSVSSGASSTMTSSLFWTDNSSNEDGFKIERGTDGINFTEIKTVSPNATSTTDSGLSPSDYYYRVRAYNAAGNSGYSNTASFVKPAAPSNLLVSVSSGSGLNINNTLSWADNSSNEDGFKIERGTDGVNFSQISIVGANETSALDSNLAPGNYYYRVRAYNLAGNTAYSNTGQAIPQAPTNLVVQSFVVGTSTNVSLTWVDNSNNETGFYIERSTDNVNFFTRLVAGINATSTTEFGVSPGTYYYRMNAVNLAGSSGYSNTASTTIP